MEGGWRGRAEQRGRDAKGSRGRGSGHVDVNLWPHCLRKKTKKKPSLRLEVIITAACYQEETSDLRSSAHLLLLPRLLGMNTKSAVSVCPPYMRLATNCFFYSTLPLLLFFFCYSTPHPHTPSTTTSHCIHTFRCKLNLLALLPALNPPPPPPRCVIYFLPLPFSLPTSLAQTSVPVMRLHIVHLALNLPSSASEKNIFYSAPKEKPGVGREIEKRHQTRKKKFLKTLLRKAGQASSHPPD